MYKEIVLLSVATYVWWTSEEGQEVQSMKLMPHDLCFIQAVSAPPVPSLQGLCVQERHHLCFIQECLHLQFPLSKGCVPKSSTGSRLKESTANVLEPLLVQVEMKQEAAFQLLHG